MNVAKYNKANMKREILTTCEKALAEHVRGVDVWSVFLGSKVSVVGSAELEVRVDTPNGPLYFSIKVAERIS